MSITTLRTLDLVERKLKNPNRWIQFTEAEDKNGLPTEPTEADACRFCMIGAIRALPVGDKFKKFAATFIVNAINQNFVGDTKPLSKPLNPVRTRYNYTLSTMVPTGEVDPIDVIPTFNDNSKVTHSDVLMAIKAAKALAKDARKRRRSKGSVRKARKQK